jgi:hypothetical protein
MQEPRATSAGPVDTGLKAVQSLRGDKQLDTPTGPAPQRRFPLAFQIDRQADCLLQQGHRLQVECLAHRAAAMREVLR